MSKYDDLVTVIDKIRLEAPSANKRYHIDNDNIEGINHARARSFIHLFLKVKFGLIDFLEREKLITDDTDDEESTVIILIRRTRNFILFNQNLEQQRKILKTKK